MHYAGCALAALAVFTPCEAYDEDYHFLYTCARSNRTAFTGTATLQALGCSILGLLHNTAKVALCGFRLIMPSAAVACVATYPRWRWVIWILECC